MLTLLDTAKMLRVLTDGFIGVKVSIVKNPTAHQHRLQQQ